MAPFPSASRNPEPLQLAQWLPDSESLLMVYQNDIYYKPSPSDPNVFRVTETGESEVIFNGVTDHLYRGKYTHYD